MRKTVSLLICVGAMLSACGGDTSSSTTTSTIPEPVETLTLAAVGDISCSAGQRAKGENPCRDADVAKLVATVDPSYLLLLGDIQYNSHTVKNFDANFSKIWGQFIPISMPVPGNHEYAEGGAKGYYAKWGKEFGYDGYYSRLLNNDWVLIGLNTNDQCEFVGCSPDSDQYAWFAAELEKYKNQCVVVMMHQPRYSSGVHGSNRLVGDVFELMDKYDVSMVLTGHDHHYERVEVVRETGPEPVQFVVGTGGKSLRNVPKQIPGSIAMIDTEFGVLVIDIAGKQADTRFVDIDENILDSRTISCSK